MAYADIGDCFRRTLRLLGLRLKLQPTRSDLVGLRPMARQAAARGRLRAGAADPVFLWHAARDALYGFGCGLPLIGRPGQLPVACPCRPSLTTWPTVRFPFLVRFRWCGSAGFSWRRRTALSIVQHYSSI